MVDVWSVVIGGIVAVTGSTIGSTINELLRRSNRIEGYSAKIFEKRLGAYEALISHMHEGYEIASEVMTDESLSQEERHDIISAVIHKIARFTDENELFLDRDLTAHCVATFMGAEDVLSVDGIERINAENAVRQKYVEARRMIREDSGVAGVDRLLKRIARPNISGDFIDYLRAERKKFLRHER